MKKTSSNPVNNPKDQMRRARRAVIKAVLCGWAGDDPCPFFSPQTRKVILMWAKSHDQRLSNSILE
ncbi:MAG: hypothetical protein ACXWKH_09920, partial [Limisphaerales bacterium]